MPGAQLEADFWVTEYVTPYDVYHHGVTRFLAQERTEYQDMAIVETGVYGKALVLDGKWQSCTGDEFLYHEPLVHPACFYHRAPESVLILGGGEGATAREALKWKTVKRVAVVDIDGVVVDACKKHLPEMHQGSYEDPRTELVVGDALHYLDEHTGEWDVIISDLSDPIEEGPSFNLFTKEYYTKCFKALKPDGLLTIQAGPVAPGDLRLHCRLSNTVRAVFPNAVSYCSHVPTYCSPWGFVVASTKPLDACPNPAEVDKVLAEQTTGQMRMFDGVTLRGMLSIPKHLRHAIEQETHVYTMHAPPKYSDRVKP